ncbi:MAG: hypothetical protein GY810_03120 [Aureispira sp.]|nr:hypothetical protein [Aureispira sp.]
MKSSAPTNCLWGKLIFLGTWASLALGLLAATWLFYANDYASFTDLILEYVQKVDWKNYFQKQVFPIERFSLSRSLLLGGWGFLVAYAFILYKKIDDWATSLCQFTKWGKQSLQQQFRAIGEESKLEKTLFYSLLGILAIQGLFNIYSYELQYDEVWTYNHFVSKGILVSIGSPNNNHIFYTLLASIIDWLPIGAKYTMRLPSYIGGLLLSTLFYLFIQSKFNYRIALVVLAYFAFSPPVNTYMLYARGYIWMMFFALGALWAGLKVLKTPQINNFWIVYILTNCLGVYSNPVYLFHFILLNPFILISYISSSKWAAVSQWFKANVFIAVILIVLHAPLLATNGLSFLTNAASTSPINDFSVFWLYINRVADWWWWGQGVYLYWIVLLLVILLIIVLVRFWKKQHIRHLTLLSLGYILMPTLLYSFLGNETPYRAWCFVIIYIAIALTLVLYLLEPYIKWTGPKLITAMLVLSICTTYSAWQHYFINWSGEIDLEAKKIAKQLQKLEADEVYSFSRYNKPLLQFYYLTKGESLKVYMPFSKSKDYLDFGSRAFDAVIWEKDSAVYIPTAQEEQILKANNYKKVYENNQIILYYGVPQS